MKKEPWENTIELIQSLIGDSYEIKRLYTREYGAATIEKKERIVDSEMTEEVTKSVTSGDKGEVLSKKEIITKYFYLLDKDDKIKVLKQIEEYIKSNKKKTSSISLDLLEDDDLKKHELPVYKTLIKKKQD